MLPSNEESPRRQFLQMGTLGVRSELNARRVVMSKSVMNGRRSAIDIVHDILTLCEGDAIKKTAVMYRCNLSYDQLQKYLALLSEQRMIGKSEAGNFQITDKGRRMLAKASSVIDSIRDLRMEMEPAAV